jgi:hypothetical protein
MRNPETPDFLRRIGGQAQDAGPTAFAAGGRGVIATCITDARTESINSLVKQRFGLRVLQPSQAA